MNCRAQLLLACCTGLCFIAVGCDPNGSGPQIVGSDGRLQGPGYRPSYTASIPAAVQPSPYPAPGRKLAGCKIVVDPGHGGRDPGAGQAGFSPIPEKTINLAIAQDVEVLLKTQGAEVIMTRRNDVFVELLDRASLATRHKADLLISIHADSHHDPSICGPSLYVARAASAQSRRIANGIHSAFRAEGIPSRGIRRADFKVLAQHNQPAVLVETGYLTNASEARNLNTNWYRTKIAKCIVAGIIHSLGR
ncbi:MAG: N-acetylmuramoyl-L-alanine amidase [Sedimentisphaerales bacterium]|nr:N-acetylmuramoyl-L-alanine amidase [Sedimentisphaerales bacterium]